MNNLAEKFKLEAKSFTLSVNVRAELTAGADQEVALKRPPSGQQTKVNEGLRLSACDRWFVSL